MGVSQELQKSILNGIKQQIDPALSFVDELADILNISKDSAYRRIRGETLFDIEEIKLLTQHFNISLDQVFDLERDSVSFNIRRVGTEYSNFELYWQSMLQNLSIIHNLDGNKELLYSARDVPIFHYFLLPNIARFKIYFWAKYYQSFPEMKNERFNASASMTGHMETTRQIWEKYMMIPSTEIWSYETANVFLRQVEYCYHEEMIDSDTVKILLDEYIELLLHIQAQAEKGNKFKINSTATEEGGPFKIYFHEVALGDHTILFKMEEKMMAFLVYGNMNFMGTVDQEFCRVIDDFFENTKKHSVLISKTSEKIRKKFFNNLIKKANIVKSSLNEDSLLY